MVSTEPISMQWLLYHIEDNLAMTDVAKKLKDASQDFEAKIKTEKDHLEGKPSSETLNKAKVKARDALTWQIQFFSFFPCSIIKSFNIVLENITLVYSWKR